MTNKTKMLNSKNRSEDPQSWNLCINQGAVLTHGAFWVAIDIQISFLWQQQTNIFCSTHQVRYHSCPDIYYVLSIVSLVAVNLHRSVAVNGKKQTHAPRCTHLLFVAAQLTLHLQSFLQLAYWLSQCWLCTLQPKWNNCNAICTSYNNRFQRPYTVFEL